MTGSQPTWRPRPLARAMAWGYTIVFTAAVLAGTVSAAVYSDPRLLVAAVGGGTPVLLMSLLGGLRPFICAKPDSLHIQNPIRRFDLSWAEIVEVAPGYHGLEITTRSDDVTIAWAVQKSNLARWLKRRTRADDVAELLLQVAAERRGDGSTAA